MAGIYDGQLNGKRSLISRTRAFFHPVGNTSVEEKKASGPRADDRASAADRDPSPPSREDLAAAGRQAAVDAYAAGTAPANLSVLFATSRRVPSRPAPAAAARGTTSPAAPHSAP